MEAEREERIKCKEEEKERDRKNFEYLQAIRREGWRKVRPPASHAVALWLWHALPAAAQHAAAHALLCVAVNCCVVKITPCLAC